MADIAAVAYVLTSGADTNNVTGRVDLDTSAYAQGNIPLPLVL